MKIGSALVGLNLILFLTFYKFCLDGMHLVGKCMALANFGAASPFLTDLFLELNFFLVRYPLAGSIVFSVLFLTWSVVIVTLFNRGRTALSVYMTAIPAVCLIVAVLSAYLPFLKIASMKADLAEAKSVEMERCSFPNVMNETLGLNNE